MTLTKAQRRNLEHVRDHGKAMHRSGRTGYWCRVRNLSEFIVTLPDGSVVGASEIEHPWPAGSKVSGERLTDAGRKALEDPAP